MGKISQGVGENKVHRQVYIAYAAPHTLQSIRKTILVFVKCCVVRFMLNTKAIALI